MKALRRKNTKKISSKRKSKNGPKNSQAIHEKIVTINDLFIFEDKERALFHLIE